MSRDFVENPAPEAWLRTDDETRRWVETFNPMRKCLDMVRSDAAVECINLIIAEGGYPYNRDARMRLCTRLGFPFREEDENNSGTSWLIYYAQNYARSDRLKRDGFAPLTEDMAREAIAKKAGVEVAGHNFLGGEVAEVYRRIVDIPGHGLVLMRPRVRNRGIHCDPAKRSGDCPARVVA